MPRRLPSTPPTLPGFSFVRVLGSGGFADVFLYEQNMPRRLVAVKVLLAEVVTDELKRMFRSEADLMAQLSAHPSILTVYQAGVAADGRLYLVMEFCSAALGHRYRSETIPIAEVLETGVRISSAVESVHREGVLHRDVKPSNILTTAYGHPVLSDFGIASSLADADRVEGIGLSVPWSAPEVLRDDMSGSVASEVWALGATVYSLLAGRSPFEQAGADNGSAALMARIRKAKLPPTGRPDVPASLERALARSMSHDPAARQASALEFARDLQAVESELGLVPTPVEVAVDEWARASGVDADERTVASRSVEVGDGARGRARRRRAAEAARAHDRSSGGLTERSTTTVREQRRRSRRAVRWTAVVGGAAVLVAAIAALWLLRGDRDIPVVSSLQAQVNGPAVEFSWTDPGIASGDSYLVTVDGVTSPKQREASYSVPARPGQRVCATVAVLHSGTVGASSHERCIDVGANG